MPPTSSIEFDGPLVVSLLHLSLLLDRVAILLRNDSIVDWVERKRLYRSVLDFVKELLQRPELSGLVFEQRPGKNSSPGLRARMHILEHSISLFRMHSAVF